MPKKKIEELTPQDFPTLELSQEALAGWIKAKKDMQRNQMIFAGIVLALLGFVYAATGEVFLPGLLVILLIQYLIQSKYKKISKELGITNKLVRKAQYS